MSLGAASATPLPHNKAVRDTLVDLLGREVTVTGAQPWAPTPRDPGAVAVVVDDRLAMRALIGCNLELAAALGASIALIPARTAEASIAVGRLAEPMDENLREVLNILTSLFNLPGHRHHSLYAVHLPGDLPASDVSAALRAFGKRSDLEVSVEGYGTGRLSIVVICA